MNGVELFGIDPVINCRATKKVILKCTQAPRYLLTFRGVKSLELT